jgi:hypothetical protein
VKVHKLTVASRAQQPPRNVDVEHNKLLPSLLHTTLLKLAHYSAELLIRVQRSSKGAGKL